MDDLAGDSPDSGDPMAAMFGQMMGMLGPMMLSMTAGSMIGHLARRSLGTYDIPMPRSGSEILIVPANLDGFGDEWSLTPQDLRLWVCLHEITHHLVLGVPHVGATMTQMLLEYAAGFKTDPGHSKSDSGNSTFRIRRRCKISKPRSAIPRSCSESSSRPNSLR